MSNNQITQPSEARFDPKQMADICRKNLVYFQPGSRFLQMMSLTPETNAILVRYDREGWPAHHFQPLEKLWKIARCMTAGKGIEMPPCPISPARSPAILDCYLRLIDVFDRLAALELPSAIWPKSTAPAGTEKGEEALRNQELSDPFAELRIAAVKLTKGKTQASILALCDSGGELQLQELAIRSGVDWDDPVKGFEAAQRKVSKVKDKLCWKLQRQNNAARLVRIR